MTVFFVMGVIILVLLIVISWLCFRLSLVLGKYSRLLITVAEMVEAGVSDEALVLAQAYLAKLKKRR